MTTVTVALPLAAIAVIIFLAPVLWVGDMLTFFLPWVGAVAIGGGLFALLLRLRLVLAAASLLLLAVLIPMFAAWTTSPTGPSEGRSLRITTFNTLGGTADPERLMAFLVEEQPDILVLQEYSARLDDRLALDAMFAYRSDSDQAGVPSVVLFSRIPIVDVTIVPPLGSVRGQGVTRVVLDQNGTEIIAYAVHATTPRRGERDWQERNAILGSLAESIIADPEGQPVIVAGDFNTPPWSPYYRRLTNDARLVDTSGAFLPPATRIVERGWLPDLFGAPVDHILVSEGAGWQPNRVGPDLGSDHLPVTADLIIPAE